MTDTGGAMTEREMLAAELAFGLIDGVDRERAEALRASDTGFADMVALWETQAREEMETIASVEPPVELWARIEAAANVAVPVSNVVAFDPAAREKLLARRLALWRGGALVGGALAASLALLMVVRSEAPVPADTQIAAADTRIATAQVRDESNRPLATAVFDESAGTMRLVFAIASENRIVPELWIIPGDGVPRSLGRSGGTVALTAEQQRLVFGGGTLAVSMEPDDGRSEEDDPGSAECLRLRLHDGDIGGQG